ncbi:MAG TPA: CBS domain-containing protein [Candidatus Methylomirabilis sp.]|nr:CBS domain-containing protein [Candidatus Methylomirabilis sp.]
MHVRERMKRDPVTVQKDDSFRYALKLIRKEGIRHLPVLDGKRLVGIVTDRDLRQSAPSPATTLEVHELNYLLERLKIEAIMTRKVITVAPDSSLLDAAKLLLAHKIGCVPVVEHEELVGIITEGDLLRALVDLQERAEGLPLADLMVEERPGAFEAVTAAVGADPATVLSGTTVRQGERRPVLLIRAPARVAADLRRRLSAAGHPPIGD